VNDTANRYRKTCRKACLAETRDGSEEGLEGGNSSSSFESFCKPQRLAEFHEVGHRKASAKPVKVSDKYATKFGRDFGPDDNFIRVFLLERWQLLDVISLMSFASVSSKTPQRR
jgi:hypothetical protein